jgi:hypothetical protein
MHHFRTYFNDKAYMRYLFALTCILILSVSSSCISTPQNQECDKFKNGEFYLKLKLDSSVLSIKRNDSIQVETNIATGETVTSKIKWTGPCEIEMLFLSQSIKSPDSILKSLQDKAVKSRIIKTSKDFYIFESKIDNVDFTYTDTVWLGRPSF